MHTRRFVWNEVAAWPEDREWEESVCICDLFLLTELCLQYRDILLKINTVKAHKSEKGHFSNCCLCPCTALVHATENGNSTYTCILNYDSHRQSQAGHKLPKLLSPDILDNYLDLFFAYPRLEKGVSVKKIK